MIFFCPSLPGGMLNTLGNGVIDLELSHVDTRNNRQAVAENQLRCWSDATGLKCDRRWGRLVGDVSFSNICCGTTGWLIRLATAINHLIHQILFSLYDCYSFITTTII